MDITSIKNFEVDSGISSLMGTISIPEMGVFLITVFSSFMGNSTGMRAISVSQNSTLSGSEIISNGYSCNPWGGAKTCLRGVFTIETTGASVFNLFCYQNSGITLSVDAGIQIIKLSYDKWI